MSLFHVNRYTGEDDDIIDEESRGKSAKQILDKIQQEAEARKKLKSNKASEENKKPSKTKRNKKLKKEDDSLLSADDEGEIDCLQQRLLDESGDKGLDKKGSPGKKLKKRKGTDLKESSDENVTPKKKKKGDKKIKGKTVDESDSLSEEETNTEKCSSLHSDSDHDDAMDKTYNSQEETEPNEESQNHDLDADNEIGGFTVIGEVKGKRHNQVKRVLPEWLSDPSVITADLKTKTIPISDITGLDQDITDTLRENNIQQFFPVQIQVIPMMLESVKMGYLYGNGGFRPSDICVSAPTGSGKTLAFVLPIVQALKSRVTCQVRALAVLPVRDLAIQVFKVFKTYCENTNLKVVSLVGQKLFQQEQQGLVRKRTWGYESLADIVVATPGRLVDHIKSTEGFSLSQLRFLVIDEADKMMDHIKQDWLAQVEEAVYSQDRPRPGALTVASSKQLQIPLQKLLFSATLSQNPDKLQQLNLFQPKLFTSVVKGGSLLKPVDMVTSTEKQSSQDNEEKEHEHPSSEKKGEFIGKYTTPEGLTEYYVECIAAQKPLIVLHFLHHLNFRNILCFTNSIESTHRLYHLIKLIGGIEVQEFSSGLHTAKRNRIIQQFNKGKIDIVICSDAMARGMDIENVKYVISYDPPPYIKTYIHRIGRTARAGKVGTAITLLQKKEFFHFKKMTREAGKTSIKDLKVTKSELKPMVPAFEEALEQLQQVLQVEKKKRKSKG